jgi:hypothetical protein
MVFPHGIAPLETLGILKKFNFSSTFNEVNIPLGEKHSADILFELRPIYMGPYAFPSLRRSNPIRAEWDVAIDLFLDIPVIFYAHHDYFEKGSDAFNRTAQIVNGIQPNVKWKSTKRIAQGLYFQKLNDDGSWDVLSYSSDFIVQNRQERQSVYHVSKIEMSFPGIRNLTVAGRRYPYRTKEKSIEFTMGIPAGGSKHVSIEYENDFDVSSVDISRDNFRINLLRRLSDFRDRELLKVPFGTTFIRFFYGSGMYKFGLVAVVVLSIVGTILFTVCIRFGFKKRLRGRNVQNRNLSANSSRVPDQRDEHFSS